MRDVFTGLTSWPPPDEDEVMDLEGTCPECFGTAAMVEYGIHHRRFECFNDALQHPVAIKDGPAYAPGCGWFGDWVWG